ncbi:hypothetical protein [Yinghuangia seranimata]|uniref:hypothetical protein n=1 Tax=Yinghuangia seranimata TaxID=408067 RepID=UPI00248D2B6B|nr:hypothetical protein [Yinghuangia seranimata]MDI2132691.1 hypothetical protein [Yinghuangia seranimata]
MTHRTDVLAAPLRPAVRALAVALLMLAALLGGTFPAHAAASAPPAVTASDTGQPMLCPFHASSPDDAHGGPGGCHPDVRVCSQSTVPPVPPVFPPPVGSFVPPWLVDPDAVGPAPASAGSAVPTELTHLCVSRT